MNLSMPEQLVHTQVYESWMIKIFTTPKGAFEYIVKYKGSGYEGKGYTTQNEALTAAIAYIDAELRFLAGWDSWVRGEALPEGADSDFIEGWTESSWAGARVA